MKFVLCYFAFLFAIFFKRSFEAPILSRISAASDSLPNPNVLFTTQTKSISRQQNSKTASFIPPFLRNLYHQLSINNEQWNFEPSLQVFKGFFGDTEKDTQSTLTFPPLYSNVFLNYTFASAELRVWYKCMNNEHKQTPYILNIELIPDDQQSISFKESTQVTCQITDHSSRPTQYNWAVFDITNLMMALQTTNQDQLKSTLKFSIKTSSHLVHIPKQLFNSKYSPSHLPLLALYNSHVVKNVETRGVSMRYIPLPAYSNQASTQFEDNAPSNRRDVRQAVSSSCSRVSKSIRVKDFLKMMRKGSYTYVFPTHFNLGYCQGYCPFKLINHHNGTTHAQIMNTIAQIHHRPRYAKCVPASYKNLYILLSNIRDDIPITTIKSYRDAIVGNCGCR